MTRRLGELVDRLSSAATIGACGADATHSSRAMYVLIVFVDHTHL